MATCMGHTHLDWIVGPVSPIPPPRETTNGIYAGYVMGKKNEQKSWHEYFRKPWEIGRHRRDFCGQIRNSRTDDHKPVHYLPGLEARDHHLQYLADTDAWQKRMLLNEYVKEMLAKNFACEKKRHRFDTMRRHKEEQQVSCSEAENKLAKLAYITDVPNDPPRARDMPEFDLFKPFEDIKVGITKKHIVFYPQHVNLPALGRYLGNLDPVSRGKLAQLKTAPGKMPKGLMGYNHTELRLNAPLAESKTSALDLLELPVFESKLKDLVATMEAKQALQPVTG